MSVKKIGASRWELIVMCVLCVASSVLILWPAARLPALLLPFVLLMLLHLRLEAKALFGGGFKDHLARPIGQIYQGFRAQPPTWMLWIRGTVSFLAIIASVLLMLAD
jgi:hypothetical protein